MMEKQAVAKAISLSRHVKNSVLYKLFFIPTVRSKYKWRI